MTAHCLTCRRASRREEEEEKEAEEEAPRPPALPLALSNSFLGMCMEMWRLHFER